MESRYKGETASETWQDTSRKNYTKIYEFNVAYLNVSREWEVLPEGVSLEAVVC